MHHELGPLGARAGGGDWRNAPEHLVFSRVAPWTVWPRSSQHLSHVKSLRAACERWCFAAVKQEDTPGDRGPIQTPRVSQRPNHVASRRLPYVDAVGTAKTQFKELIGSSKYSLNLAWLHTCGEHRSGSAPTGST